jgi:hypothetical protein
MPATSTAVRLWYVAVTLIKRDFHCGWSVNDGMGSDWRSGPHSARQHFAATYGRTACVSLLVQHGADVTVTDAESGWTALHRCGWRSPWQRPYSCPLFRVLPECVTRIEHWLPACMAPVLSVLLAHRCFKPLPLSSRGLLDYSVHTFGPSWLIYCQEIGAHPRIWIKALLSDWLMGLAAAHPIAGPCTMGI